MTDDGPQRAERAIPARSASAIPPDGSWPCQTTPVGDLPVRAVAFFYRLLRDGASGPGDVEGHMLQAGLHDEDPAYTNCHLEILARAHVTWLLQGPRTEKRDEQRYQHSILLAIGAEKVEDFPYEQLQRADFAIAAKGSEITLTKDRYANSTLEVVRV